MNASRRTRIGTALAVVALCASALLLRWRGLEHSLPHWTFRDGYYVFTQVALMRSHDPEPERQMFWGLYPHLVADLVAALPDPNAQPLPAGAGLAANLERAAAPWMQIREISVLLSVLAVAATYGIARAFLRRGWSLFAGALVATSLLQIFFAQQEKCHGPASGTAALGVLAAIHLWRRPTIWSATLAGLAAALAIGTLQSGAAVLFPLAVAALLAACVRRPERPPWTRIVVGGVIALALIAIAIRVLYPFHFSDMPQAEEVGAGEAEGTVSLSGHHIELSDVNGGGFKVILDTLISFEPTALVLVVLALGVFIVRRVKRTPSDASFDRGALWVVLSYVAPYTLAVGIYSLSFERFVIPLLPFLATFAAFGAQVIVEAITSRVATSNTRAILRGALALLLLSPAVSFAWQLCSVRAADDTFQRTAAWIHQNVQPERERIYALPYIDLPLLYSPEALQENADARSDLYWLQYQLHSAPERLAGDKYTMLLPKGAAETKAALGKDPLAYFERSGVDYVVIQEVSEKFRFAIVPETRAALRSGAELVARMSPVEHDTGEAAKLAIRYTTSAFVRPFFVHLANLRCEGPTIEIYRLKKRDAGAPSDGTQDAKSDEQRRQIAALEAIGYAGGTTPASGREGVIVHDEQRAFAGLNLMLSGHAPEAVLADMNGRVVHRWSKSFGEVWPTRKLPESRNDASTWRRARVLPGGELLAIFEGLGLVKLTKDSEIVWSYDGLAHHALDIAPDGRVFVLTRRAHIAPGYSADKPILEDFVTILDAGGRELESISLLECFKNSPFMAPQSQKAGDIFHTNALHILDGSHAAQLKGFEAGNVLVSLRTTGQLAVVDLRAKTVVWELRGDWKQQHEPTLLDNGRILLFDNKGHRERSSVLEIEPTTGAIAWSYSREKREEFFSASCGSAQRLANGNTLIVSSEQGRAFEVTPQSEIVWEYDNPHRLPSDTTLVALLFDCVRLDQNFKSDWIR